MSVPARPKPGRKTAVDEPTSKRKAQNRQAQRNFRQRKLEHAHSLETSNQELRAENQQLLVEIERLTHAVNESQQQANRFQSELEDWQSRYNEIEGRWSSSLSALTRFQEQSRTADDQCATWRRRCEAKAAELDALERKLSMLQRQPSAFNASSRMLPPSQTSPSRPQSAHQSTQAPAVRPSPRGHATTDGCGNCDGTGECPCVDSYIDASAAAKETGDLSHRKSSTMSIHSVLSPPNDRDIRARTGSQTVPDLVSDVSSENDGLETDFTTFTKNNVAPASATLNGRPTAAIPSTVMSVEKCGFCTDDSNCLCTEVSLDASATSTKPPGLPSVPTSRATPTSRPKPGSCPSCQSNPDQKAFCESLAREHAANRKTSADGHHAKRPRLESSITIPCADAYPLFKRLSRSREGITYETLYNELVKSRPGSWRVTGVPSEGDGKGREFSAFEADIGEVLASMHRYGSSGNGSGSVSGRSEGAGIERLGNNDAITSSGARERVERMMMG